jgi:hypothetical protein
VGERQLLLLLLLLLAVVKRLPLSCCWLRSAVRLLLHGSGAAGAVLPLSQAA